jgi:hypothetical protein
MNLSALDLAMWAAGFIGNAVLFAILIHRRRCREFPVFTALIGFEVVENPLLFAFYRLGTRSWYERLYWAVVLIEFLLQLGVIWEVARIVMRPTGTWLRDAKKQFILVSATGLLLAAALAWMVAPAASTTLERMEARSDLFTDLVVCELFVVMLLTAKRLGLGFRNHVFALVTGWSVWVIAAMLVDLLHGYYGTHLHYDALDNVRKFAYLAALVYWMVQFWLEEPARQEIPPELRAYILALHSRVRNDLDILNDHR